MSLSYWRASLEILCFTGGTSSALWEALRRPRKIRWREVLYYMDTCGREAVPIVTLICLMMGMILGFQSGVQMRMHGLSIFAADLVGFSILKELGPLMVAMVCCGRAGSAFAAEIGSMKVNEEIDAMTTMGFSPGRFLVVPKIIALVLVMPMLTILGDLAGVIGGFIVGVLNFDVPFIAYYERTKSVLHPMDLAEGLIKSFVFAFLVAAVGCLRGMQSSTNAQGVGRAATSAVVSGIFLVILSDVVMTLIFSNLNM